MPTFWGNDTPGERHRKNIQNISDHLDAQARADRSAANFAAKQAKQDRFFNGVEGLMKVGIWGFGKAKQAQANRAANPNATSRSEQWIATENGYVPASQVSDRATQREPNLVKEAPESASTVSSAIGAQNEVFGGTAVKPNTSIFAIIGIIAAGLGIFLLPFFSVAGIILGCFGINDVRKNGKTGQVLAIAAIAIGVVGIVFYLILKLIAAFLTQFGF